MSDISISENTNITNWQYENKTDLITQDHKEAQQLPLSDNMKFENAFNKAKQYVEINDTKLSLSYDKENNEPVIYVMDNETDEIIRRIPPEKLVEFSGDPEKMKGLFFQEDV